MVRPICFLPTFWQLIDLHQFLIIVVTGLAVQRIDGVLLMVLGENGGEAGAGRGYFLLRVVKCGLSQTFP